MKKLWLKNLKQELNKFDKIIVTGPPRSGTTISAMIIANELKYKFIDESWYDGNDRMKFFALFSMPRKMVIHTTAFSRDLYNINDLFKIYNVSIILIKRDIKGILESFENTKKFSKDNIQPDGLMTKIGDKELVILYKHYGIDYEHGNNHKSFPEVVYDWFYAHKNKIDRDRLFFMEYPRDFMNHKLYIKKRERRTNFEHMKQVKLNDPYYLTNQKGIMVL